MVSYSRSLNRDGPVTLKTKIFQGIGALPGSHKDFAFNTLLLLYYNQILGVPATAVSIALAAALVVDAFTDPMVGAFSDNLKSRFGRRHPLMYAAAVPMGLLIFALFSPPAALGEWGLIIWLLCTTVLLNIAFTFYVVPWNALAAELSMDYVERTSIIAFRHLCGWIGGVIFYFTVMTYLFAATEAFPQGQLNPDNYRPFAMIVGVLIPMWILLTTYLTRDQVPYLLQPENKAHVSFREMGRQCLLSLQSRNFRLIVVGHLVFVGVAGVTGVFDALMNTFFWGFAAEDLRWFTFTIGGALLGIAASPLLQERYLKQHILLACLFVVMIMGMLKVLLRFSGVLPDNGDPMLVVVLVSYDSISVFLMTVGGIMFASMIADLVDEQELNYGIRQEGVFSSVLSFAAKASSSLGIIIGGLMLDFFINFPRGQAAESIDPDIMFRLAISDGILVNIMILVPVFMLLRYTVTRESLAETQAALRERHQEVAV